MHNNQNDRTSLLRGTIQLTEETNQMAAGIGERLRGQRTSLEDGSSKVCMSINCQEGNEEEMEGVHAPLTVHSVGQTY